MEKIDDLREFQGNFIFTRAEVDLKTEKNVFILTYYEENQYFIHT